MGSIISDRVVEAFVLRGFRNHGLVSAGQDVARGSGKMKAAIAVVVV